MPWVNVWIPDETLRQHLPNASSPSDVPSRVLKVMSDSSALLPLEVIADRAEASPTYTQTVLKELVSAGLAHRRKEEGPITGRPRYLYWAPGEASEAEAACASF